MIPIFKPTQDDITETVHSYSASLYRLCFTLLANAADAEDAVSDTILRYMTKAPRFRDAEHKKAWLLLTMSAPASGSQVWMWSGHTGTLPAYTALPTAQECRDNLGVAPHLVQSFDNGYTFERASIGSNNPLTQTNGTQIASVNGIDLTFSSYNNKLVPETYKFTAEDEAAKATGELVFSYGGDRVEIYRVDTLFWEQDGIQYALQQLGDSLTPEELIEMATELITE